MEVLAKAAIDHSQALEFETGRGENSSQDCLPWSPSTPGWCATFVGKKSPTIGFHGVGARPEGVRSVGFAHDRHLRVPGGGWQSGRLNL